MIPRRKPYFAPNTIRELLTLKNYNQYSQESTKLENDLKKILRLPNPVVIGQGRIGLKLILQSLGIKPGSEIIMPGYTFGTLTKVIKDAGFIPIPVDIDRDTLQMSPRAVNDAITTNTSAILATHLFGEPCDIYEFKKLAKKHKLHLIEDCAQSLGATINGKLTGTFGDAAFSSFDIAKNLQGIRGGVVFSDNKRLMNDIKLKRDKEKYGNKLPVIEIIKTMFGYFLIQTPIWYLLMYIFSYPKMQKKFVKYYRSGVNKLMPYSLPPIYARIVRNNLSSLVSRLAKRRRIRELYYYLLKDKLSFQTREEGGSGSVYMILAHIDADIFKLRRYLSYRGVDIALADEIADDCINNTNSNVVKAIRNAIGLPIYQTITKEDVRKISMHISNFLLIQQH